MNYNTIENKNIEDDKTTEILVQEVLNDTQKKKKAIGLIHRVYLSQLKNSRKYLASTKTKSEVRGGGRKPWRQKGTGRARAGSLRSPLFVGGGVIFGPKPRIVFKKINKKERRLAILTALYLKKKQTIFIDNDVFETFNTIKTKKVCDLINNLKLNLNSKILFVLTHPKKTFWLATRNLKNVEVSTFNTINLKALLKADSIILSKTAFHYSNTVFGKQYDPFIKLMEPFLSELEIGED